MTDLQNAVFNAPEWLAAPPSHMPTTVEVIGAGGTGGEVLDQLCRLHATLVALGHPGLSVTVYDGDTVSASNVGRQRFSPLDIGQPKASTLVSRINMFYGLCWDGVPLHWTPDTPLTGHGLVISCTDSAKVRHEIATQGANRPFGAPSSTLWLDFGNGRTTGQAVLGHLCQKTRRDGGVRLPHIIDLYPDMVDDPNDGPTCSVAEAIQQQAFGVNATLVTSAFASILWPLFREGRITRHGLFMDVAEGTVSPLRISPVEWAFLGYEELAAVG